MKETKQVVILLIGSWAFITIFYSNNLNHMGPSKIGADPVNSDNGDYLIKTAGCIIPNYTKTIQFEKQEEHKVKCGERAVFIIKIGDNITFRIDENILRRHQYLRHRSHWYKCCYRFASRSTVPGQEDTKVTYSQCTSFVNGTTTKLDEEVIVVFCISSSHGKSKTIQIFYQDAYMVIKKNNKSQSNGVPKQRHWNLLVLGIDTMSRARLINTMPKTFSYLNRHGWLDFKGYQKVHDNTFPNVMAFLTGWNLSTVYKKCRKSMSQCNDGMIWSKFKRNGYVTAFGEEWLNLPDIFTRGNGFRAPAPPTDHYMRPLFLTGETAKGNLVCTKQLPSAISVLNYASDFVNSYKKEKFFGMFWLNSYSHDSVNLPSLLDEDMSIFLNKLNTTGTLSSTFIFFLSDHGFRFGKMRQLQVEYYYDERLPMFFMWAPLDFRQTNAHAYHSLEVNRNRLTTPYDLYQTFQHLLQLSSGSMVEKSESCTGSASLFKMTTEYRTCASACVDEKWCSCHNLTSVDQEEYGASRIIKLAVSYIQNITKTIKTTKCTKCQSLMLKTVLRTHLYIDYVNNKVKYVIAFEMSPDYESSDRLAYEISVLRDQSGFHIIQPTKTISQYGNRPSFCLIRQRDRAYCLCVKKSKCN